MKKIVVFGLALLLAALALSARWWLPQLLSFAGTNADAIQSITSLIQLLIWAGAAVVVVAGWAFSRQPGAKAGAVPDSPASDSPTTITSAIAKGKGSIAGRDFKENIIVTGHVDGDVVKNKYVQAPPPIETLLYQLQSPPQDFTDRKTEIAQLMAKFESGTTTFVLYGINGIGKSVLAYKFTEQLKEHYKDAQIYLDLQGTRKPPLSVNEIMTHVIRSFNLEARLSEDEVELSGRYNSVLEGKRVLLLMDNAANAEQVAPLLQSDCALVVTSRKFMVLPKMHDMKVDTLSTQDARALLKEIAGRINDQQADTIAKLCGGLPLALRFAAGHIKERRDLNVADYVQRLQDAKERPGLVGVEASLTLSYEDLGEEQQKLFRSLAVFPNTFDVKAAAAVWDMPPNQAQDALSELLSLSLVEWDEATFRYRLQELVRLFADARLSEDERSACQRRHALHFLNVLREVGELYYHGGKESRQGLNLFDVEWANIQAGQEWAKEHIGEEQVATAVAGTYTYEGAYVLALRRLPKERISWHEAVISAARQANKPGVVGSSLCFQGIAYRDLAKYDEVIEHCQQALEIARQENDPREESNALSCIGIANYYQGEYQTAIEYCQPAVDITQQRVKDRRNEIEQLRYLGHARRGLGQFEEAVKDYQLSLEAASQIGDLNGAHAVLGALGRINCDMGKHEQAIKEYLPEAVRVAQEIGDRRGAGFNLAHMALAHRDLGRYEEAKTYCEQALPIAREISDRSIEAYALGVLGKIQLALGQSEAALENAKAAVEAADQAEMKRAQQHWRTAQAQLYLHLDQSPAEALKIVEDALAYDSRWGNHRSLALKGLILARLGQSQPAHEAFTKASEHARRLLEKTPSYFDARYSLALSACGMILTATGEKAALIAQARAAYADAYAGCSSPGVIEEALRLLDELLRVEGAEELGSVRDYLLAGCFTG